MIHIILQQLQCSDTILFFIMNVTFGNAYLLIINFVKEKKNSCGCSRSKFHRLQMFTAEKPIFTLLVFIFLLCLFFFFSLENNVCEQTFINKCFSTPFPYVCKTPSSFVGLIGDTAITVHVPFFVFSPFFWRISANDLTGFLRLMWSTKKKTLRCMDGLSKHPYNAKSLRTIKYFCSAAEYENLGFSTTGGVEEKIATCHVQQLSPCGIVKYLSSNTDIPCVKPR